MLSSTKTAKVNIVDVVDLQGSCEYHFYSQLVNCAVEPIPKD